MSDDIHAILIIGSGNYHSDIRAILGDIWRNGLRSTLTEIILLKTIQEKRLFLN